MVQTNISVEIVTTTEANANGRNEDAYLTDPPIIDEDAQEIRRRLHTGPELYKPGELPRPRFVMLGQQGVGKVRVYITGIKIQITKFYITLEYRN